jgi:hypothetical protein
MKILGNVVDEAGAPLPNIPIHLVGAGLKSNVPSMATTSAAGAFAFPNLQVGDKVSIHARPFLDLNNDGEPEWELVTPTPIDVTISKNQNLPLTDITYRPIVPRPSVQQMAGQLDRRLGAGVDVARDIFAYPALTREVGPASSSDQWTGDDGWSAKSSISHIAGDTLRTVLGWRPQEKDPAGFVGALTQAFTLEEVEGHVEWEWMPRTYAVQTDLAGGISGAQASLHIRANEAFDSAMPLLDGLYPLRIKADPQDTKAVQAIVRMHWKELVDELGVVGGPRVSRVDQLFLLLLGAGLKISPNRVGGDIGTLRREFGFDSATLVNTLEEEQNLTNFRILTDYTTGLRQTWAANRQFFTRQSPTAFFGTQLVLLSRQLSVIAESVNEVRFALDSVFIGPSERQTIEIQFANDPSMFVEELLSWVQAFSTREGPRLIQDGGKFAVENSVVPVLTDLRRLVRGAARPINTVPDGYATRRVRIAWTALADQLDALALEASRIRHKIPSQP